MQQLGMKILPYLRNHEKKLTNMPPINRNDNQNYNSELAEKVHKNAWTNLPELLRQIALANAQKQQQAGRKTTKMGFLYQGKDNNSGDFVPSVSLASDNIHEDFYHVVTNLSFNSGISIPIFFSIPFDIYISKSLQLQY